MLLPGIQTSQSRDSGGRANQLPNEAARGPFAPTPVTMPATDWLYAGGGGSRRGAEDNSHPARGGGGRDSALEANHWLWPETATSSEPKVGSIDTEDLVSVKCH